jgi:hypothetical protein
MTPINRFILHVVHNWVNELNEEYSEGTINRFIKKFSEEAEDFNVRVTEDELRQFIKRFDTIKNSPKIKEKDLDKYTVGELIKLVRTSRFEDEREEEDEDRTPDVVYQDNGITIWNGAKQGNCIVYGASQQMPGGLKWCITQPGGDWWGRYRYGSSYGYPTFYLAKNNNLSDSDILSFVAIQVLQDGNYKFTNRANSPQVEGPFDWDGLLQQVPWLRDIPNLKNTLKYIPLSGAEKGAKVFRSKPLSFQEWAKEPFATKRLYINARAWENIRQNIFSDITNNTFLEKYISRYPEIATLVAKTPGVIQDEILLANLDKFSDGDRTSITTNMRNEVDLSYLGDLEFPFGVKKILTKINKWDLDNNERVYLTKDKSTIVKLTLGDKPKVDLYREEDIYPNIKLNKRTSKYLLDYPELDKIPLPVLVKLSEDDVIDKEVVTRVLNKAKSDPNSAIIVKNINGKEIILDSNTFASYEILENGNIRKIPFNSEEVQQMFNDSRDNEAFQQNIINLFGQNIPPTVDKEGLISIVNAIPYNQRLITVRNTPSVLLSSNGRLPFFAMPSTINPEVYSTLLDYGYDENDWRRADLNDQLGPEEWISYFNYLRATNQSYSDDVLLRILNFRGMSGNSKKAFIANNPPVNNDGNFKPVMNGDTALLINKADPRNSRKVSDTDKLVKVNIPSAVARQLLGGQAAAAPDANAPAADNANVRRRGRPAGVPNAPRPQQQVQPAVEGNLSLTDVANQYNLVQGFNAISRNAARKFRANGMQAPVVGNRGASARNNMLGNAGRVTAVYEFGPSDIYIIRLANNTQVASIVAQPGNIHYLVTDSTAYQLSSPRALLQVLQQRNLAEIRHYIVREYFGRNPQHLDEFKQLFNEYITEKKKQNEVKRTKSSY